MEVGTDVFEFEKKLYLLLVDYYSRWIEVVDIAHQTSGKVISAMKSVFSRLGVPQKVRSDNASYYVSSEFLSFAADWGFRTATSSPRYPPSNGLAERAVGTVKRLWRKSKCKESALLSYRVTPLRSGFSPSELLFSRTTRSSLGLPHERRGVDYELFEHNERADREDKREKWNSKHRAKPLSELSPGQLVWVKAPTDDGMEGVVLYRDVHPESYWVEVGRKKFRRNRKHLFILYDNDVRDCSLEDFSLLFEDFDLSSTQNEHGTLNESPSVHGDPTDAQSGHVISSESELLDADASVTTNAAVDVDANSTPVIAMDGSPPGNVATACVSDPALADDACDSNQSRRTSRRSIQSRIPTHSRCRGSDPLRPKVSTRGRVIKTRRDKDFLYL